MIKIILKHIFYIVLLNSCKSGAMKIMDLNEVAQKEMEILKSLNHPNVVKYFDHFEIVMGSNMSENKQLKLCIVTEFCEVSSSLHYILTRFYFLWVFDGNYQRIDLLKLILIYKYYKIMILLCYAPSLISYSCLSIIKLLFKLYFFTQYGLSDQ